MKKRILLTWFVLAFAIFAKAQTHWTAPSTMAYNMTGNAVVFVNGSSIMGSADIANLELGVFKGDECRGCALPIENKFPPTLGTYPYVYNMMIYSQSLTESGLTFRLYNHLTNEEECLNSSTSITFESDGSIGNLANPLQVQLVDAVCFYVTATANPVAGGTVTGGGHIREGNPCTLVATPTGCYQFVNWTHGGQVVSTNASYTFTPTEDIDFVANFEANPFTITASVDPATWGTVTGAGTYDCGSTCTLNATPATGYQFVNWTKGGVEVSTNAEYSFTVEEDAAYVAHFTSQPYEITATANPTEGGSVSVEGPLTYGSTCTLKATPAEHYAFVNWTLGGAVVSTNANYSFTVVGEAAYVANFELASYEITATVNPAGTGTVEGAGSITYGQTCTLTATANGGYEFANWTLGGVEVSTDAAYSFTVYEAATYVANFAPKTYYVTVAANPADGGFVSRKPEPTIGDIYDYGQQVKLRAVPQVGYEFVNWTKGDAKKTFQTRDANEVVTYTLDGTVTSSGNAYATASEVTQDNMTWMVMGNTEMNPWRIGGKNLSGIDRPVYSTQTISDNISKIVVTHGTASNITVNSMTLIVSANSDFSSPTSTLTGGFVAESTTTFNRPDGVSWAGQYYKIVYNVSVSGNQNKFIQFVSAEFYKDNNGGGVTPPAPINMDEPEITITVNDDNSGAYTANFQTITLPAVPTQTHWTSVEGLQYTMNITGIMVLDGESMKNNDIAQYLEIGAFVGDECRGSFLPTVYDLPFAQGYFYEMTINGNNSGEQVVFRVWNHTVEGGGEELDVTSLSNIAFIADGNLGDLMAPHELEFETNLTAHYNIVATASPSEGGTVTGSGSYEEDTECTLVATADSHYDFTNWTLNGQEVSTNATYTFTVTAAGSYVANFTPKSYEVTISTPVNGTVEGAGIYVYNTQCVLTATPAEGYHFVNWTMGGVEVSTELSYAFAVEGDANYEATFAINTYEITAIASPDALIAAGGGSVTGAGTYEHFSTCTLIAIPYNDRWVFENWTENDVVIDGATDTLTFEVTGPRNLVANFAPIYTITATVKADIDVDNVVPGTIEGAGDIIKGRTWTLTETPDAGYTFVEWKEVIGEDSVFYSNEASISEAAFADRIFVATYALNSYDIALGMADVTENTPAAAPALPGSVTGDGNYHHYDTCTVVAIPEVGYHFVNWTVNGTEVSASSTYEFVVTAERSLVANFELDTHVIAVTVVDVTVDKPEAAPAVPGTVTGADTYNYYATCTLVATPEVGYHFVNWTEGGVEVATTATYEFMVEGDRDLVANFELDTHVITLSVVDVTVGKPAAAPDVPGTVTGDATYNYYATCTLVATPEVGYHFVNWTESGAEVSTSATYEFMVTEDRALVANFELDTHDIAVTIVDVTVDKPEAAPAIPGSVTGADTYYYYATCTLVATPEVGYHFVNWTEGGVEVATTATYEFMVEGDRALVANFELDTHDIAVTIVDVTVDKPVAAPDVPGTVTGADTYNYYATCTLVATPEVGYHFVNWTEGGVEVSTSATYEFMVTEDRTLVANFELDTHVITLSVADVTVDKPAAAPAVPGTVTGADTYNYYATCTVVATPEVGYHFVNWTANGTEVSTSATYEFMVEGDRALVANFELDTHDITVTVVDVTVDKPEATPAIPGTVTGADTYNYYATCTLVATPEVGYHFVNWIEGGVEVATSATYEFMVTEDRDLIANFELDTHVITLSVADVTVDKPAAAPAVPGTVTGADTYNYYATCTVVATPEVGYHFVNWTANGTEVSTSATYEFMVVGDRDLVANFELDTHVINVTVVDITVDKPAAAPAIPGTVTGANTYNYYATCTLVATPEVGYHFVNWTEGGVVVETATTYQFMVTENRDLVANFELDTHTITVTVVDVTENIPSAAPAVPGSVTGDATYNYYATCTLVATPATGYHFVNWTESGQVVATEATYSFMVTEDRALVANFELDTHVITLSVADVTVNKPTAAPTVPGTVTGDGTYNYYATCTVVATPATGYHFVNWTEGGVEVSTDATYEFMVEGDRDLVANFELDTHNITVTIVDVTVDKPTAAPAIPGSVTGADTYNYYATCTLVATPAEGYHFVNWTESGQVVTTEATYSFMVAEDRALVANFELNSYEITASSNNATFGSVSGAGTFKHYENCTLTATPATGYHFVNWTENGTVVSTSATYGFMVTGERALVANFEINSYNITATANPTIGGSVTGAGNYNHFVTCTLVATPATGYHFVNWTLNGTIVSTDATYSFEVDGPAAYVANFEINTYEIAASANPISFGTVTGAGTYDHFSTCTLTATPSEGHTFFNWTENDVEVSTNITYSFTVTGPRTLVAHFINRYAITVTANPTVGGTVTGAGVYDEGSTVTLTATPATGYHFVNWSLNNDVVSTDATYNFTAQSAGNYVAHFAINNYAITAVANPAEGGTVTGAGNYDHFQACTLTATANTGYTFVNWTKNGNVVSTNTTLSFTVEAAADYVANFELNSYEITATLDPTDAGTVTGAGTYNHFATCTLTANPTSSYLFVNWTMNGAVVSTEPSISFEVTGPAAYVAHFIPNTYEITATVSPDNAGIVEGAGTYYYNTTCELTATPNTGYHFVNWTENGVEVATTTTISFVVSEDRSFVANFAINNYAIALNAIPAEGGSVTGGGNYDHFQICTIVATPAAGYNFVRWIKNGETVSTDATYSFEVTESAIYKAQFTRIAYTISAEANPEEGGTITGTGSMFYYNTTCQLIALANPGYHFVNWTKDGAVVSTDYIYNFTVTTSAHFVANFAVDTYQIAATIDPETGGTVTGTGTYNYGATATLIATPAEGFVFVNWTEGDVVVSEDANYSFTVTGDRQLVAHFYDEVGVIESEWPVISAYPNPATDKLFIETYRQSCSCEIYTITGAKVYSQNDCGEKIEVEVSGFASGAYIVRIISDSMVQNIRFIKD